MDALILLTTCPNTEVATELARNLVQQKLAACINIIPKIHSIYRWHDAIEEAKEVLLLIKTTRACYAALEEKIIKQHPYETPEIVALSLEQASQSYLQWMLNSCEFPKDLTP